MKKISKSSELLWILGIIFVALGVSLCNKANLGVSMIAAPAFVIYEAIAPLWSGFSVGMTEYLIQALLLVILCIIIRKFNWRFLLAFAVAFVYGYVLDFFLWALEGISFDYVWLRWLMLIVGDCVTALGIACFFKTYMPLTVYELFVYETSTNFKTNINKIKWIFDISLLLISIILTITIFGDILTFEWSTIFFASFHSIGLGTIITTIINSPIIFFMSKLLDKIFDASPRFIKMHKFLTKK